MRPARLTGQPVSGLRDVQLHRWVPLPGPVRVHADATPTPDGEVRVRLSVRPEADPSAQWELAAEGGAFAGPASRPRPAPVPPPVAAVPQPDPYESAELFHGPALRFLTSLRVGPTGSSAVLDASLGAVPFGELGQGLLDGLLHAIPSQSLWRWIPGLSRGTIGYSHRLVRLDLYEPLPRDGEIRVEARFAGFADGNPRTPLIDLQAQIEERVIAALRLVKILVRVPEIDDLSLTDRRAFLDSREYVGGFGISDSRDGVTTLSADVVARFDVLPGTIADVYGLPNGLPVSDHVARIAVQEHVGRLARVHPGRVEVAVDLSTARVAGQQGAWMVTTEQDVRTVTVRTSAHGNPRLAASLRLPVPPVSLAARQGS